MNKKEFLREVAKRFKYVRKPIRMGVGKYSGLQEYSMWIAEIKDQTVEEIAISFWVGYDGSVVVVQPGVEYARGIPMVVKQLKEILDRDKSNLNKK